MAKETIDLYAQMAYMDVVESAANTLTFSSPLVTGINVFEKKAFKINRLEYIINQDAYSLLINTDDNFYVSVVASNQITGIGLNNQAVIDHIMVGATKFGTPATAEIIKQPIVKDLSTLPGGGILVIPSPIYLAVKGTSLASAVSGVGLRFYFTVMDLKPEEYWELLESRRLITE